MLATFLHWKDLLLLAYEYVLEYENTWLIRFLASEETVGLEGKFRSIFIILHNVECILIKVV